MQLDKTRIAIRERSGLEIYDLALQVLRAFFQPLMLAILVGAVPLAVLNFFLAGPLLSDLDEESDVARYLWVMVQLVVLEAPLASVVATVYLGDVMFLERPTFRSISTRLRQTAGRLFVCVGLMRGVIPGWILVLLIDPNEFSPSEVFLPLMLLVVLLFRASNPFLLEIILLEQSPLSSRSKTTITIGRRCRQLHGPDMGELLGSFLGMALVAFLSVASLMLGLWFIQAIFLLDMNWGPAMLYVSVPAAMWMVNGFMTIVRFLSYLDLRIRREGWAVELQVRAEAARLARQMA